MAVAVFAGVMFVALMVAWGVFLWKVTAEQNRLLTECRERGEPLAPAELEKLYPPVDDADNAAIAFMKLWAEEDPELWEKFANRERPQGMANRETPPGVPLISSDMPSGTYRRTWEAQPEAEPELWSPVLPMEDETLKAGTGYLSQRSNYIADVRRAASHADCRFPIRFEDGGAMLIPHLAVLKGDAQLLRLDALLAAERGDTATAQEDLVAIGRIERYAAEEPILISQLVAAAVSDIHCNAIEEFFSRIRPDEAMLSRIEDSLGTFSATNTLRLIALSEQASFMGIVNMDEAALFFMAAESGEMPDAEDRRLMRTAYRGLSALGLRQMDQSHALKVYGAALKVLNRPEEEIPDEWQRIFEAGEQKARGFPPLIVSSFLLSGTGRIPTKVLRVEARQRAAGIALAFERFRIRNGRWPQTLEELGLPPGTRMLTDPFTGEPMRVRHLKRGFVIYSLGPDRTDEGGRGMVKSSEIKSYDVAFVVER